MTLSSSINRRTKSPEHLADFACTLKKEDERDISTDCYENIWVVVDVDDFHDHSKAAKICKDNGIELIISNPCFEVCTRSYEGLVHQAIH